MQQVGRYRILDELGRGAMGVVYRAQDPAIGRTIAIKTIRLSDLTDPSERDRLRDRLFREAQSAGILSHPNIVTIYDILEEGGLAYIFMEFVNGPALEQVLGSEIPPQKAALLSILRQTAAALDYAHRKGIVHRDIKPGNIMIHDESVAKITDFGVAKIASQQITMAGMMMGTPSYMSPEQVQGGEVTGCADQFSLGVIAYEMLTGEKPFIADSLPALLFKICREDPVSPQRLNPTLPADIDPVLKRALAKNAGERFGTCTEFVSQLERALGVRADWAPLARGASLSLPTISSLRPPASDSEATVADIAPAAQPPRSADIPPPRLPQRLEEAENHTVRNVVLALSAIVLLGAAYLIYDRMSAHPPQPPPVAEQQPPASAVPENQKPSPVGSPNSTPAPAAPKTDPAAESSPSGASPEPSQQVTQTSAPPKSVEMPKRTPRTEPPELPARTPGGQDVITRFVSSPPGARVSVDGTSQCNAPCSVPLAPGRHTLFARADGFRDFTRVIEIPQDSNFSIDMDRQKGILSVSSTPAGATILLNGQIQDKKTPATMELPVGFYRLQVLFGNIKSDEITVQIRDGAIKQQKYTLE